MASKSSSSDIEDQQHDGLPKIGEDFYVNVHSDDVSQFHDWQADSNTSLSGGVTRIVAAAFDEEMAVDGISDGRGNGDDGDHDDDDDDDSSHAITANRDYSSMSSLTIDMFPQYDAYCTGSSYQEKMGKKMKLGRSSSDDKTPLPLEVVYESPKNSPKRDKKKKTKTKRPPAVDVEKGPPFPAATTKGTSTGSTDSATRSSSKVTISSPERDVMEVIRSREYLDDLVCYPSPSQTASTSHRSRPTPADDKSYFTSSEASYTTINFLSFVRHKYNDTSRRKRRIFLITLLFLFLVAVATAVAGILLGNHGNESSEQGLDMMASTALTQGESLEINEGAGDSIPANTDSTTSEMSENPASVTNVPNDGVFDDGPRQEPDEMRESSFDEFEVVEASEDQDRDPPGDRDPTESARTSTTVTSSTSSPETVHATKAHLVPSSDVSSVLANHTLFDEANTTDATGAATTVSSFISNTSTMPGSNSTVTASTVSFVEASTFSTTTPEDLTTESASMGTTTPATTDDPLSTSTTTSSTSTTTSTTTITSKSTTTEPTKAPSTTPTKLPTQTPTSKPTTTPSKVPTQKPSNPNVITLEPDADTWIIKNRPENNYSDDNFLFVKHQRKSMVYIRFDVTSIPADKSVSEATLRLCSILRDDDGAPNRQRHLKPEESKAGKGPQPEPDAKETPKPSSTNPPTKAPPTTPNDASRQTTTSKLAEIPLVKVEALPLAGNWNEEEVTWDNSLSPGITSIEVASFEILEQQDKIKCYEVDVTKAFVPQLLATERMGRNLVTFRLFTTSLQSILFISSEREMTDGHGPQLTLFTE